MISAIYAAAPGQDFPNHKCNCKGCGANGGDVTGQCASVCKDKTVYNKGSESYDYCKAAVKVRPWAWPVAGAWTTLARRHTASPTYERKKVQIRMPGLLLRHPSREEAVSTENSIHAADMIH